MTEVIPGLDQHLEEIRHRRGQKRDMIRRRYERFDEVARVVHARISLAAAHSDGLLVLRPPDQNGGPGPIPAADVDLAALFPAQLVFTDEDGEVRDGPFLNLGIDSHPYLAWSFSGGFLRGYGSPHEGGIDPAYFQGDHLDMLIYRFTELRI